MIQHPLTVSFQQREKKMFDGKLNTQRENCIFLTLYNLFHGSNTISTSTIGCRSFQTCVTFLKVHLFTCVFLHMFQGLILNRSHLQRGVSRSHETCARYNSTEAFASGSSASKHSDVTVRFFESDTRVTERAGFRVHSTWVSGNSTRLHADFTPVVIFSVTVRLMSKFLFRCPGKSDFRSTQVTSTQCTQFTLERLDLALHGGKCDGIDLTTFSHSD